MLTDNKDDKEHTHSNYMKKTMVGNIEEAKTFRWIVKKGKVNSRLG